MKPQLLPADVDAALGMMPDPSLHRELLEVARSTLEGADLAALARVIAPFPPEAIREAWREPHSSAAYALGEAIRMRAFDRVEDTLRVAARAAELDRERAELRQRILEQEYGMRWDLLQLGPETRERVKAIVRHLTERGWPADQIKLFGRIVTGVDVVLTVSDVPEVQLWVLGRTATVDDVLPGARRVLTYPSRPQYLWLATPDGPYVLASDRDSTRQVSMFPTPQDLADAPPR